MVAVGVSVAVSVLVSVSCAGFDGAVEDYAQPVELLLVVEFLYFREHLTLEQSRAEDEDCPVAVLADNLGVGNQLNRRTVDEHVVIVALEFPESLLETLVEEQFGGVRRYGADRQHVKVGVVPVLAYYSVEAVRASREVVAEAFSRGSDKL